MTGKGRGAGGLFEDEAAGVLRRSVPQWLRGPEYHSIVVGFEEASRPHGGAGALYVRLRRRRPATAMKRAHESPPRLTGAGSPRPRSMIST